MLSKPDFKFIEDGPEPMDWEEYTGWLVVNWRKLLDDPAVTEKLVHAFMEEHVCCMPCPEYPMAHGGWGPLAYCVASQPLLPGFKKKVPDFLYFTGNSVEIKAILIEIESPKKRWFTDSGDPSAEFTQAKNQLNEWRVWFADHKNMAIFEDQYQVRASPLRARTFYQKYLLVIGRNLEFTSDHVNRLRAGLQREDEVFMTYDRLKPMKEFNDSPTVRLDCSGHDPAFRAIHIPPTFRIGPNNYPNLSAVIDLDVAISRNALITEDRKKFLLDRLKYWRDWHNRSKGKITPLSGMHLRGE